MPRGKQSHKRHSMVNAKKRRKRRAAVIEAQGNNCFYCTTTLKEPEIQLDHFWPTTICFEFGLPIWLIEHISNKRVSCGPCNTKKADSLPGTMEEFWCWVKTQTELRKLQEV